MPSLRWDCSVYASTVFARGPVFEADPERYQELYVTGPDLTMTLRHNARGEWPEGAHVETPRVHLGVTEADGVGRVGRVMHELAHGVTLRFVLVADEAPPPEAWGPWRLRHFDKAREMAD